MHSARLTETTDAKKQKSALPVRQQHNLGWSTGWKTNTVTAKSLLPWVTVARWGEPKDIKESKGL